MVDIHFLQALADETQQLFTRIRKVKQVHVDINFHEWHLPLSEIAERYTKPAMKYLAELIPSDAEFVTDTEPPIIGMSADIKLKAQGGFVWITVDNAQSILRFDIMYRSTKDS